ncbi:MAG: diguanylate cyclase [Planctomycetota bacterium]
MSSSPMRAVAPLFLVLGVGGGGLALAWRDAEALAAWAAEPGLPWALPGVLAAVATVVIVSRSYGQLRQPPLYSFVFLVLPWLLLQPPYYANAAGERAVSAAKETGRIEVEGAPAPAGEQRPQARRFIGLPDSLAKRYPELPQRLRWGLAHLHALGFLLLPLVVFGSTAVRGLSARPKLRKVVLALFGLEVAVAALALTRGGVPAGLIGAKLLLALYLGAGAVALITWRSAGGLGGAVAALLLLLVLPALAEAGVPPSDLGLPLKPIPFGVERALCTLLPWLLLGVVAREWIVGMAHSTQHDALTQVFNKAYAEAIVNEVGGMSLGRCYSVAILDIDHFKKVNDTHGHPAGDDVLQVVAKTISDTVGNRGLVCRTGGEEITVFFPGVEVERAQSVCEEVRVAVEALHVATKDNDGKRVTLNVTLSVGVATNLNEEGELHQRIQDVVAAADRAVYAAKNSGRNRVVLD